MAIWVVWRNYIKHRSENRRDGPPAKALGLIREALDVSGILGRRLFPHLEGISGWLSACYFGAIPTRAIEHCERHRAKHAA